mgnify:CR=1 FL=1
MKNENSSVRNRLKSYIKYSRMTQDSFAESLGLSRSYVNAIRKGISNTTLDKILEKYPDLNRNWLLFGEGEMIKNNGNNIVNKHNVNGDNNYNSTIYNSSRDVVDAEKVIPYIDTSIARKRNFDVREAIKNEDNLLQKSLSDLFLPVDYCQKMNDDSMQEMVQQGDLLFVKFLPRDANLVDGSVYLIFTKSYGILLRQVKINGEEFILRALNHNYGDITIHRDDIIDFGNIVHLLRSTFYAPKNFATLDTIAKESSAQVQKLIDEVREQNTRLNSERDKNDKLVNALLTKIN